MSADNTVVNSPWDNPQTQQKLAASNPERCGIHEEIQRTREPDDYDRHALCEHMASPTPSPVEDMIQIQSLSEKTGIKSPLENAMDSAKTGTDFSESAQGWFRRMCSSFRIRKPARLTQTPRTMVSSPKPDMQNPEADLTSCPENLQKNETVLPVVTTALSIRSERRPVLLAQYQAWINSLSGYISLIPDETWLNPAEQDSCVQTDCKSAGPDRTDVFTDSFEQDSAAELQHPQNTPVSGTDELFSVSEEAGLPESGSWEDSDPEQEGNPETVPAEDPEPQNTTASDQKRDEILPVLEGLLFIAGEEGITMGSLHQAFKEYSDQELEEALTLLASRCAGHGIELACYAGAYKLVARAEIFPYAQKLYENIKAPAYSSAALETLAIIAYKQPVTRVEIEEIRGVACDGVLKKLLMRDLIAAETRSDSPGKPLLYTVTETFMDAFGLESLDELPDLESGHENLFESVSDALPTGRP